ncbi:MAG TPA: DUF4241 domain-containing protein [Kofleriaceae bacterium]|nr:DUF4241 domain-containing protein [Kofleriaceae bacterium]
MWFRKKPSEPVDRQARGAKLATLFDVPKQIAALCVPTGRLVIGPPPVSQWSSKRLEPLDRPCPTGTFPVDVCLTPVSASSEEAAIAAVRIMFSQTGVARWEVAMGGSAGRKRAADGTPGFNSARAVMMDAQTVPLFDTWINECNSPTSWEQDVPFEEGKRWCHATLIPDETRPENIAIFSTGTYDGVFVSYWGLDAQGAPVVLITDFNVVK